MKEVGDNEVKELKANSKKVVVVDLFAPWCGPCKMLLPKMEELSQEKAEVAEIVKLDIDKFQETPMEYGVRGVPTLLFFKDGQLVETLVGNQPKDRVAEVIDKISSSPKLNLSEDF